MRYLISDIPLWNMAEIDAKNDLIKPQIWRMEELLRCAPENSGHTTIMSFTLEQAKDSQHDEKEFRRYYWAFMSVARAILTTEDCPAMFRSWSRFYPDKPWEDEE